MKAPPRTLPRSLCSLHLVSADLALLALFSGNNNAPGADASAGSSCGAPATETSNTVVMGQVLAAPATAQPALAVPAAAPVPAVPTNAVQQLQFQAVMQHQAAIMQNPQAYPAAAQMYQQAVLAQQQQAAVQQHMLAQQQAVAGVALPPMPMPAPVLLSKRGKTQQEVEEQTERIKKRRRESAQRRCVRRGTARAAV